MWRLLVAALLVSGCSWDHVHTPPHGDVTFTPEERAAIERGAAFLSAHANTNAFPIGPIVWDAPHTWPESCAEETIQRSAKGDGAITHPFGARCIALGVGPKAPSLDALAAHEFGHWIGMEHVSRGLMQPFGMSLEWSDEDQAECVRVIR